MIKDKTPRLAHLTPSILESYKFFVRRCSYGYISSRKTRLTLKLNGLSKSRSGRFVFRSSTGQTGFTLIEVMAALLVTGVVVTILMTFATTSLITYTIANTRAELLSEMQLAMDIASNDVRLSAFADQNNRHPDENAPGAPTDLYSWESDADTLILAVAAEDEAGNILFADPLEYISHKNNAIYFVEGNTLYKRILAAPVEGNAAVTTCPPAEATAECPADRVLLDDVSSFSARYLDALNNEVTPSEARSVELSVASSRESYKTDISVDYTTRMVFRND